MSVTSTDVAKTRHGMVLMAAAVMPAMAIIALVPVLPMLMREFAQVPGAAFLVPAALTVPALCVALFSPVAGWLSDRFGRKPVLITALFGYAAIGLLPLLLTDLYLFVGSRILLGLAEAAIMTVSTALIGDYFEGEHRERWIATQVATVSVSAILLIAAGGALGEAFGSRGPFFLYLLALPVGAIAALTLFEPHRQPSQANQTSARQAGVLPLLATTFFVGILFYTVIVQLGPILERVGTQSPALIGLVGAGANLGVVAGSLLFARLKGSTGPRLLALGLSLAFVGYSGISIAPSLGLVAFFIVVACVGSGVMLPNMLTWTMSRLPFHSRGAGTGSWTGSFFLGQFAAPLLVVGVSAMTAGLGATLLIYGLLAGVAAIAALVIHRAAPLSKSA